MAVGWFLAFAVCATVIYFAQASLRQFGTPGAFGIAVLIIICIVSVIRAIGFLLTGLWEWLWLRSERAQLKPKFELWVALIGCAVVAPFSLYLAINGVASATVVFPFARGVGKVSADSNPVAYWLSIAFFIALCLLLSWVCIVGTRKMLSREVTR